MIASLIPGWIHSAWVVAAGVVLLLVRYFNKKDSPAAQYEEAKSDNAKIIETRDEAALNADITRDLDRLRDDQPRSGDV